MFTEQKAKIFDNNVSRVVALKDNRDKLSSFKTLLAGRLLTLLNANNWGAELYRVQQNDLSWPVRLFMLRNQIKL